MIDITLGKWIIGDYGNAPSQYFRSGLVDIIEGLHKGFRCPHFDGRSRRDYFRVIGIDVGKPSLVIYDEQAQEVLTLPNTQSAITAWLKIVPSDSLLICEASGGYEARLLSLCARQHKAIHRADALKVKRFIASLRHHGKTDPLDAKALARYGRERVSELPLWKAQSKKQQALQQLMHRREDIVALRATEKTRLKAPGIDRFIQNSCQAIIKTLDRQIHKIDRRITTLIVSSQSLSSRYELMIAQPGIGPITAQKLIAFMPELGQLTRRQAASLAGVAPHPNDSGQRKGYRSVRGGRPHIRRALFMAAMGAARSKKSDLAQKYQNLLDKGKKPMVALTAIMCKIIIRINAKIRDINNMQNQS